MSETAKPRQYRVAVFCCSSNLLQTDITLAFELPNMVMQFIVAVPQCRLIQPCAFELFSEAMQFIVAEAQCRLIQPSAFELFPHGYAIHSSIFSMQIDVWLSRWQ